MGSMTQIRIYDDKFQIWNNGSLIEGLTIEQLKSVHPSKPRNKLVADVCLKAGYIEAWGTGIPRVIEACKKSQLPSPIIEEIAGGFQITVLNPSKESLISMGLNERQIKAFIHVQENEKINNATYQEINNVGKTTATKELNEIVIKGFLYHEGKGRGSSYTLGQNKDKTETN